MDSLITAAALALAAGDPLAALNRVALREDPPALALRGIAMAQLGDLACARTLIRRAARAFGASEPLAQARCIVAEADIALALRELNWSAPRLSAARTTLEAQGEHANAAHASLLEVRRLLLAGRLDEAEAGLGGIDTAQLPAALRALHALVEGGIAMRRLQAAAARTALGQALRHARASGIAALQAEVEAAWQLLAAPCARLLARGREQVLKLEDVEAVMGSAAFVVDACRNAIHAPGAHVELARRPILFALARALAQAWPGDVPRDALIRQAFRTRYLDDSHRVRLRVELGRLRTVLEQCAAIGATDRGYVLAPHGGCEVLVLAPPVEEAHATILACLADGQAWSSSGLALALDASQRTVQRALDSLANAGKVQAVGHGRARRWITPPLPGIATALLLPQGFPRP